MDYLWYEKYLSKNIVFFCGQLGMDSFKIGFTIGKENCLYLGIFCIGIDINN